MKLYSELAEYYFSIELKHRSFLDEVALIRHLGQHYTKPQLLDLGCGTGEHLAELSRYGYNSTGVDISAEMIRIAEERFAGSQVHFLRSNILDIDYYEHFDMVISLFGSLNYLTKDEEMDRALWNTWRAMKPGGSGLFEIWNSVPVEMIGKKDLSRVSSTRYRELLINRERGFKLLSSPGTSTIAEVSFHYSVLGNSGVKKYDDRHIMRTWKKDELLSFFSDNGLTIQNIFSTYTREPYRETSGKMLLHFTRA